MGVPSQGAPTRTPAPAGSGNRRARAGASVWNQFRQLAGLEAAVEDADPAVGELSKGGLVAEVPGPEGVVDLGEIAMGAARAGIVGLPPYGP